VGRGRAEWYTSFPGLGPALPAAEPPYNAHLVTDTGAGFLAVGVVLAVAALVGSRAALTVALLGLVAFSVPHLIYHAAHPSPLLSASRDAFNVVVLGAQSALPLLLLVLSRRREENP